MLLLLTRFFQSMCPVLKNLMFCWLFRLTQSRFMIILSRVVLLIIKSHLVIFSKWFSFENEKPRTFLNYYDCLFFLFSLLFLYHRHLSATQRLDDPFGQSWTIILFFWLSDYTKRKHTHTDTGRHRHTNTSRMWSKRQRESLPSCCICRWTPAAWRFCTRHTHIPFS